MASAEMSGVNGNRSMYQEIDDVRECIEKCMQMYMSKTETVNFLAQYKNIQPGISSTVWMRLAEDNPEFFRAYNVRLAVQEQIMEFNRLLSAQAELTRQREFSAANAFQFDSNPSFTTQQMSTTNAVQGSMNPEPGNMNQVYAFNDYASLIQASTQRAFDQCVVPQNMFLPQSSNSAPDYSFGRPSNFGGLNPPMGDASISLVGGNGNYAQQDYHLASVAFLNHHQQQASEPGYLVDSTNSSGFSLSSNGQYLGNFTPNYSNWEHHLPISTHEYSLDSTSSTGLSGNVEMMDPRSTGGWRNQYFGQ